LDALFQHTAMTMKHSPVHRRSPSSQDTKSSFWQGCAWCTCIAVTLAHGRTVPGFPDFIFFKFHL